MENFAITITYLLIGMALRRVNHLPEETGRVLNLFVIYVSLPALVLLRVPEVAFSGDLLVPALMPWAMVLISVVAVVSLSVLFKWTREVKGALLLLVPLGNTSFLGIPMVTAFFGERAVPYALLYDQLGSFLALATYGTLILAFFGKSAGTPSWRAITGKIVTFPPFIALILAVILRSLPCPPILRGILIPLSSTLVPVVMIAVGFQLTLRLRREVTSPLAVGLALKLVCAPATALVLTKVLGLSGEAVQVSVFEAGMPPMVSAGALAIVANLSPPLTAALVGLGIVLSFATLPLLYQLLGALA